MSIAFTYEVLSVSQAGAGRLPRSKLKGLSKLTSQLESEGEKPSTSTNL
jgi:hypothetical protein